MISVIELKIKLKNITNGRKYITNFINNQPINIQFNNEEIQLLLTFHPNKKEKNVDNIEYLIIRNRPPYNGKSLYIKTKNNDEDDISYILCLRVLYEKYDKTQRNLTNIITTFRNTISNTSRQAFFFENCKLENNEYYGLCSICGENCKVDIDHYEIPFQKILNDFLKENSLIIEDIKYKEINNCLEFIDYNFKNKWIQYHDKIAQFRCLCKYHNRSIGSNGYKSILNK
jgi:hypothetical protein